MRDLFFFFFFFSNIVVCYLFLTLFEIIGKTLYPLWLFPVEKTITCEESLVSDTRTDHIFIAVRIFKCCHPAKSGTLSATIRSALSIQHFPIRESTKPTTDQNRTKNDYVWNDALGYAELLWISHYSIYLPTKTYTIWCFVTVKQQDQRYQYIILLYVKIRNHSSITLENAPENGSEMTQWIFYAWSGIFLTNSHVCWLRFIFKGSECWGMKWACVMNPSFLSSNPWA